MATRRYRKRSKKSLKKRTSKRRKNVRSSRRMRGGLECTKNNNQLCEFGFVKGQNYKDSSVNEQTLIWQNKNPTIYEFLYEKDIDYCLLKKESTINMETISKNRIVDEGDYQILQTKNNDIINKNENLSFVSKHIKNIDDLKKSKQYTFLNLDTNKEEKFSSCVDSDFLEHLIVTEIPVQKTIS